MGKVSLPHLVVDMDRHGNVRHYVRIKGRPKVRLPGAPGSSAFMEAYGRAVDAAGAFAAPAKHAKGTFRALCTLYFQSKTFRATDASTQAWRRRALERVCRETKDGLWPAAQLRPKDVRELRDELSANPAVANTRLKAMRALFAWAFENDHVPADPTIGIKKLAYASSGHHAWTLDEVAQFVARHPRGTKAHLAMALMFYTTGRREDAVRLGPQHVRGGRVRFTQAKNEHRKPVEVDIPLRPELAVSIGAAPASGHLTFLTTEYGRPFSVAGFGNWFRARCDEAGLKHCSAHGLRKAMATWLAEQGATAHEIMAVTGHQSLEEAERYTRAASRSRLATSAMAKRDRGEH
jgi:integrase